jgi:putative colanic acid biosynthesis UDP-glucose lipid carrier transferase
LKTNYLVGVSNGVENVGSPQRAPDTLSLVEEDRYSRNAQSAPAESKIAKLEPGTLVFAIVDLVTVAVASVLAKILYLDIYLQSAQPLLPYIIVAVALGIILSLVYEQMGLYRSSVLAEPVLGFGKIWGGLMVGLLILLGMLYILKISDYFSRGWVLTWLVLNMVALVFARWQTTNLFKRRITRGRLRPSVAIYGSRAFVGELGAEYGRTSLLGDVAGIFFAPDAGSPKGGASGLDELRGAMSRRQFTTIIIALPASDKLGIQAAVKSLAGYSTELLLCSDLSHFPVSVNGSRSFGNLRMDVINVVPGSEFSRLAKPLLDYTLAAAGLLVWAPVLLIIAALIKLDSPGPVFFRQRRYGHNNQIFRIFKFRTMTVTEDGPVVVQAKRDDARVTRVGRFLRRTSLDELPQLINVLLGDMSLVGPRPHAVAHDEAFESKLDLFSRRRRVKPGLTGWAQVNGYRGETRTIDDIRARMQHDLYYIDNWSIWLDLEIIARTVFVAARQAY